MALDFNKLNFEEFHGWNARLDTYYISITVGGSITLYRAFYEKEAIDKYNYVLMMYDRVNRVIGLKFSATKDEFGKNVAKLNKQADKMNAWISAGNFFKHYDLNADELKKLKGKYIPVKHESETGTIYAIDLNDKKAK